jgi:hypothetical protein
MNSISLSFAHCLSKQEFYELQDLLAPGYGFDDLVFYFKKGDNGSARRSFMDDLSSAQIEDLCAIIASKPSSNQSKDIFGTPNFAPRKNFSSLIGVDLVFRGSLLISALITRVLRLFKFQIKQSPTPGPILAHQIFFSPRCLQPGH